MDQHAVIRHMGRFPDKILPSEEGMKSKVWKCSNCMELHRSDIAIGPPAPCSCGSIFFDKKS